MLSCYACRMAFNSVRTQSTHSLHAFLENQQLASDFNLHSGVFEEYKQWNQKLNKEVTDVNINELKEYLKEAIYLLGDLSEK